MIRTKLMLSSAEVAAAGKGMVVVSYWGKREGVEQSH